MTQEVAADRGGKLRRELVHGRHVVAEARTAFEASAQGLGVGEIRFEGAEQIPAGDERLLEHRLADGRERIDDVGQAGHVHHAPVVARPARVVLHAVLDAVVDEQSAHGLGAETRLHLLVAADLAGDLLDGLVEIVVVGGEQVGEAGAVGQAPAQGLFQDQRQVESGVEGADVAAAVDHGLRAAAAVEQGEVRLAEAEACLPQ